MSVIPQTLVILTLQAGLLACPYVISVFPSNGAQ